MRPQLPWYIELFDELYLATYADIVGEQYTLPEVDAIEQFLALRPGSLVLDLACGQGRHLLHLASRGYSVVGLDRSDVLMRQAHKDAQVRGLDVSLVQGDMRTIPFENAFDGIFNWFTAFGYFETEEEDEQVLAGVARALKPGGRFVLETRNPIRAYRQAASRDWLVASTSYVTLDESHMDYRKGRMYTKRLIITPEGKRVQREFDIRVYLPHELERLLRLAGLDLLDLYGGLDRSPLTPDSPRLILTAQKTG